MKAGCEKPHACEARDPGRLCRGCTSRSPIIAAKRRAAMRAKFRDPEYAAAHRARINRPEDAERMREVRRANAKPAGHPARLEAGRKRTEAHLGWCPPEFRPAFKQLRNRKSTRHRARAMVEAGIERWRKGEGTAAQICADLVRIDRLPWCPPEYHDLYRELRRIGTAASARAAIEAEIARAGN